MRRYSGAVAKSPHIARESRSQPARPRFGPTLVRAHRSRKNAEQVLALLPIRSHAYRTVKRLFDIVMCLLLLLLCAVPLLTICAFVILTSGLPIFYRQQRIGQRGKPFTIYKFRTMRNGSAQLLADWLDQHPNALEEWQRTHKLRHDPRITWGGRFLRETSLDELPQIFNVLRGEMSLVGPRPIVQAELERYGRRAIFYSAAVPGITGIWQTSGRCNVSYQQRVRMDEQYVRRWSLLRDLSILLRTPRSVLRRDGAC